MGKDLIFIGGKVTSTSDNTGLCPIFTIEKNAKFSLEVSKLRCNFLASKFRALCLMTLIHRLSDKCVTSEGSYSPSYLSLSGLGLHSK